MRPFTLALTLTALIAGSVSLLADPVPYPNVGTIAPTTALTASSTGDIIGYFAGYSASDDDSIRLLDVTTGYTSAFAFNNQTTSVGATFDFGAVNAGDTLVFELENSTYGALLTSDPAYSDDGINHAYVTSFAGGTIATDGSTIFPAGIYVGMEDLPLSVSDLDYNDDTFVFTNVAANSPVPEPSSLMLFGTGLLGIAGAFRRRILAQ